MSGETHRSLRVAIIGGCQVVGLTAAAERLLPGAEIKTWHVGVNPKDSDEELLALLANFNSVISQLSDWDPHIELRISRLRERGLPVVYLPPMVFAGFHPDLTYIRGPDGLVPGPMTDYHSVIAAAAFTLGLPEQRVTGLFNAFVFSELGYFDVFDAARTELLANFKQAGYELSAPFDLWLQQVGQFMYTFNHPHIKVLGSLCRLALARAGHLDPAASLPDGIDDDLAMNFTWPVYPALARRIGLVGSNTFLRGVHGLAPGQTREIPLAEYVSMSFRVYEGLAKDMLRTGVVATASERLGSLVVS